MKVANVEEMRELDEMAIGKYNIAPELLMENAGNAMCFLILRKFGIKGRKFSVFCGPGNKGGDGFVVARKLHSNGGKVKVVLLEGISKFKGAAKNNLEINSRIGIEVRSIQSIEKTQDEIANSDAIIDAIFGAGLERNIVGAYRRIIQLINDSKKPIFSIDIPSGINGNTGKVMGVAVKAKYTLTFGLPKLGNLIYPGFEHCGELYVSHISFPPAIYESLKIQTNEPVELPKRIPYGHKGDFGDTLFIGGAPGYYGAPYFSAASFLKAGGGYSRLAIPKSIVAAVASMGCELVFVPLDQTKSGSISMKNRGLLLELAVKVDMVVIGPGMSLDAETQKLVCELATKIGKPVLIDGDGLTAISQNLAVIRNRNAETILTPHMGEMARITKKNVKEIDENRIEILRKTAKDLRSIIILKGAHSLIGYPDGDVYINMSGNCGMATAGSGDVLNGTIAAMFGLGLHIREAARIGVYMHGLAGDLASIENGNDGITAHDILNHLPLAVKCYRERLNIISDRYELNII